MTLYYSDDSVQLFWGDCLTEHREWLDADVLVTDPPYGRDWQSGSGMTNAFGRGRGSVAHGGIANDKDPATRDAALEAWGQRHAIVFGDLLIPQPKDAVQALVYAKPEDAGIKGARAKFRRDAEAIYLVGPWRAGVGGRSSILRTNGLVAGPRGIATRAGHPHAKPLDLLENLIDSCPPGMIADPFAGSGSTLVAAKALGRKAIGVELEERYLRDRGTATQPGGFGLWEPRMSSRVERSVGRCDATGKAKFTTRKAAKTTARRHDRTQHPYPCDCGYWHLGHMTGHDREWHRQQHGRNSEAP